MTSNAQAKLDYIAGTKTAIGNAITAKGVTLGASTFRQYADRIAEIATTPAVGHRVRYFDPFGTLIDTQTVTDGGNATAPSPPTLSLLTFHSWNHPGTNITRDEDIGGVYNTTDGKTYIYIQVNALTGLQPTIYYQKSTSAEMTIDWGDGNSQTTTSTGNLNTQKAAPYAAVGNYLITITCSTTYNLGNGSNTTTLFGSYSTNPYTSIAYKIYFGANTTLINNGVFYNYFGLDYVVASSGMTGSIGAYAFYSCSALTSLTLPSGMTGSIGGSAFQNCYALTSLTLPSGMTGSIGGSAFNYCSALTSLTLPSGMTGSIGTYAFSYCSALTSLTLPSGMTGSIGNNAFNYCSALTSLTLPSGMTGSIGTYAFSYCSALTSLTLPSGTNTAIGDSTFRKLMSVRTFTVLSGFTSLAANAFEGNNAMDEYIFQPTSPPTMAATSVFTGIKLLTRIYVPDASTLAYRAATNWTTYADYIYPLSNRSGSAVILFESNGGTAVTPLTGTTGNTATEPTAPTKDGFTFSGWYKESGLTNAWNWASDVFPATNLTLYAKWV